MPNASIAGARAPWWRRLVEFFVGKPHVFTICTRCGDVLGEVDGVRQPWRKGERDRSECFGQANLARFGEPPHIVCIRLRHVRYWA